MKSNLIIQLKKFLFILMSLTLVVLFQNCSDVQFEDAVGVTQNKFENIDDVPGSKTPDTTNTNDGTPTNGDCPQGNCQQTDTNQNECESIDCDNGNSNTDNGNTNADNGDQGGTDEDKNGVDDEVQLRGFCHNASDESLSELGSNSNEEVHKQNVIGRLNVSDADVVSVNGVRGWQTKVEKVNTLVNLTNIRSGKTIASAGEIHSISNIRSGLLRVQTHVLKNIFDVRGVIDLAAGRLDTLSNQRGAICLRLGSANELSDLRGAVKIIGSDSGEQAVIKKISNTRGVIILKNVNLGLLQNHRGRVILINSTIAQKEDVL